MGVFVLSKNDDADDITQSRFQRDAQSVIGHYRIREHIETGGMGDVYLAEDISLHRSVVLKFLPEAYASDPEVRARFTREARAAARLSHPNIVTVYEIGEEQGRLFLAMEYVEGETLRQMIKARKVSLQCALECATQLAAGLHEAHSIGVVHRDIKPSNIKVDRKGNCKLLDFGLATIRGYEPVSHDGSISGTIGYMSPEQIRGESADSRSDLFSLGIVLFEMLTGKSPFLRDYEAATLLAIVQEAVPRLDEYITDLPLKLQAVIDKALEKEPAERYQTAAEMLSDLREVRVELETRSTAPEADSPSKPSIAVLPFTNLSDDRAQDYFCDGMAEEIINALAQVDGLRVVARTSAFSFRGKEQDIREIGRKLNVATVLEGSVRKANGRIRITTQLINVADGYHLWSEKYDRNMQDIFSIQDEIALTIVDRLKVRLLTQEKTRLTKRYTEDQEAYKLYLQGRYFWNRRFQGGLQKSIEFFQRAIARDPEYALAYVGVADAYNILGHLYLSPMECYPVSKKAVETALAIDNSLAEAHAALGWLHTFHSWDFVAAEREFRLAVNLNPNYSDLREFFALLLGVLGRYDEGLAQVRRGLELDPVSLILNAVLGLAYYWGRRYDEALAQIHATLELEPEFFLAHLFKGLTLSAIGKWDESIDVFQHLVAVSAESPLALGHLGMACGLAGRTEEASQVLDRLSAAAEHRHVPPMYPALVLSGLGRLDEAFDRFEDACEQRDSWMPSLLHAPNADHLRSDPRFERLLAKIWVDRDVTSG